MNKVVLAARLSSAVYAKLSDAVNMAHNLGFLEEVYFWSHADTQAMLCESKDEAWLVFRGTEPTSLTDIWHNVSWPTLREWDGVGQIHSGYKEAFRAIRLEVNSVVAGINKPLYVAGHSMGGALATLYCSANPDTPEALYLFAATKALDDEAAAQIKCPTYRLGNRYDVANYWPPLPELTSIGKLTHISSGKWYSAISRHRIDNILTAVEKKYG